ncbi:cilia- and flagella-associated protein 100-like [Aplochiton taeniatus]
MFFCFSLEKHFYGSLPTEAKSTYLSRLRCRSAPLRYYGEGPIQETEESNTDKTSLANVENKTKYLEEDAIAFEKFIKENDQKSVEAVKMAEKETMLKVEKIVEIKKVTAQISTMKSDISKYQEILKEYQTFKDFLTAVAPPEWREQQNLKKQKRIASKTRENQNKDKNLFCLSVVTKDDKKMMPLTPSGRRGSVLTKTKPLNKSGKPNTIQGTHSRLEVKDTEISDSDEEPELYFSDPRQMFNVLTLLEEQNLSYIQNFQETEEAMDEILKTTQQVHISMNNQTEILQQQIDILKNTIQRDEEKTAELKLKSKIFSFGEFKADKQGEMLNMLHKKVKDVYRESAGEVDAKISTLNMLASIEHRLEEVMDGLEILPPERVEAVKAAKEKEKRQMYVLR